MSTSELACHSCRKRKVKCDRNFPQCMVCDQAGLACNYPLRQMKPGPKIGSLQRPRRRRQPNEVLPNQQKRCHLEIPDDFHNGDVDALDNPLEKQALLPTSPTDLTKQTAKVLEKEKAHQKSQHLKMLDLAFILHPSHEATTPDQTQKQSPASSDGQQRGLCRQACTKLGISQTAMNQMYCPRIYFWLVKETSTDLASRIKVFFENMTAVNIFHEPSFAEKLMSISSLFQLTALLAAVAGFSARFDTLERNEHPNGMIEPSANDHKQPSYFMDIAFRYINEALEESDDEMPSLCIIQALVIATHCRLSQGARGKAWRSLGLCVSLLYETDLHLLDSGKCIKSEDPQRWQEDEEKRRVFWAIWEMDVFASTIRRTPTAIDWNQMEILLPVDNSHWFSGRPTTSCFMEVDPNQRWKTLQDSGSQSPKAWFLVINSLMKEAQILDDLQGMSVVGSLSHQERQSNARALPSGSSTEARQKLETLANAVRCFNLALPDRISYRDQYLGFGAPAAGELEPQRQLHSSIYNIFVMTQLARLIIYRYDAFGSENSRSEVNGRPRSANLTGRGGISLLDADNGPLHQCYEAADRILGIVNRSCEEHIRYINPFLSSTVWLASAVQLVRTHFAHTNSSRNLIKSRFDVLYLTYKRCVHFWDTKTALQRNLELIEEQLEVKHRKPDTRGWSSYGTSKSASHGPGNIDQSLGRDYDQIERPVKKARASQQNPQYLPESFNIPLANLASIDDELDLSVQDSGQGQHGAADGGSMLDYMSLPQPDRHASTGEYIAPTNSACVDSMYLNTVQQGQCFDWGQEEFPGTIHDLLAGWTSY